MELNEKQKKIVYSDDKKSIVIAAAASGKTHTIAERVKYLLSKGVDPRKIVMITFTNSAAETMIERVGQVDGLIITTIHGYANYLLLSAGIDTSKCLNKEKFDELFEMVKEFPKCIREVDYLIADEFQDSPIQQYEFLLDMVKPKHWMLVADPRQSIYQFAGARPDLIISLSKEPDVTTYYLNQNYRNDRSILGYAKSIIHLAGLEYDDKSIAMKQEQGKVIDTKFSADGICRTIKKDGNYKDWFILTRTNKQLDIITRALEKYEIPFNTFKRADLSNAELNKYMTNDTVKALTIHASKGLEAKKVIVVGAKFYSLEEICISYVAATRAKELLVWASIPNKRKIEKIQTDTWE